MNEYHANEAIKTNGWERVGKIQRLLDMSRHGLTFAMLTRRYLDYEWGQRERAGGVWDSRFYM